MTFKPKIWQPIAVVLCAVNLVAVGFAAGAAEPSHAAVHAALALGFGLWASACEGGCNRALSRESFSPDWRIFSSR